MPQLDALNRLYSLQNLRRKGGKLDHRTGRPKVLLRHCIHGELGFSRWKKTWVYPSVPANSRPWTARCGDRYDPQLVKRSSE